MGAGDNLVGGVGLRVRVRARHGVSDSLSIAPLYKV
jgi:hypothetical protein